MEGSFFMGKNKFTYEQKLEAILNITDNHMSIVASAKLLGCGETPLTHWLRLYQNMALKG
jgi:transposase-like protein